MIYSFRDCDVTAAVTQFLAHHGLSPRDFSIFYVLWFTSARPSALVRAAVGESRSLRTGGDDDGFEVTLAQAQKAMEHLIDRGFAQVVDESRQAHVTALLEADRNVFYTPDQIPPVGDVDLSDAGIQIVLELYRTVLGWNDDVDGLIFDYVEDDTVRLCSTSLEYMQPEIIRLAEEHGQRMPSVKMVGGFEGWRDRWWRKRHGGVVAELAWQG